MHLSEVVDTSAAVAATRSRLAKVKALAAVLRAAVAPADAEDVAGAGGAAGTGDAAGAEGTLDAENAAGTADTVVAVVSFLIGTPRQGRIGTGWRTVLDLSVPPAAEPSLTVAEVDLTLGAVATTSGKGSAQRRVDLLVGLFGLATAAEQDFLRRLLTGELRQGALEGVMLDAIASAADVPGEAVRRAFMLSGRLPETAVAALRGGAGELEAFRLEVGRPLRPMLASPAESLDAALTELGGCVVEHKLDGARIQVHRSGDEVHVYTRTLREITKTVPELVELVRGLPCTSVVLDGETLALTDEGRPRPFQETMSRFGAQDERELLLHPYFFDCLHLDGEDLLDEPLRDRLAALRSVAGEHVIPGVLDPSPEEAGAVVAASLGAGHEGVMVKSLSSVYAAGRRGRSWQKVKPVHTLDLVVLGVEWGSGRRRGWLSNLHLGARDPDGGPPIMVGKTFKGLTDELLTWQTKALQEIAVFEDEWVVMVRPELVIEIELDGVQVSSRYPGGVALRFARVVRYRPDKDPSEATTIEEVRALLPTALSTGP